MNSKEKYAIHFEIGMDLQEVTGRKEGNVLFNDALNTFYLRLYGVSEVTDTWRRWDLYLSFEFLEFKNAFLNHSFPL